MRKTLIAVILAGLFTAGSSAVALGHRGGHQGGCEEFGQLNRQIGADPAAFGFGWADNLGTS